MALRNNGSRYSLDRQAVGKLQQPHQRVPPRRPSLAELVSFQQPGRGPKDLSVLAIARNKYLDLLEEVNRLHVSLLVRCMSTRRHKICAIHLL